MDTQNYVTKLNNEMRTNTTNKQVATDTTTTVQNKVNKIATNLCSRGTISANVKGYVTTTGGTSDKLQESPKLCKSWMPLRTIVNGRNHLTEKMAKVVEYKFARMLSLFHRTYRTRQTV